MSRFAPWPGWVWLAWRSRDFFISALVKITLNWNFCAEQSPNDVLIRLKSKNIEECHFGI
jgi:hypothetical protein